MNTKTMLAGTLLLGCVTGAALRDVIVVPPARAAAGTPVRRYEYKVVHTPGPVLDSYERVDQLMNRFGAEGWRLAGAHEGGSGYTRLFFERELTGAPASGPSPATQEAPPK